MYHFPEDQRVTGLFDAYVNTSLKIKQESGGWPSWTSEDPECQRDEYVRKYQEREGIQSDKTKIAKNPGRKTTANLMFNSFWGKFGEPINKFKMSQCTQANKLFAPLNNPLVDISAVSILSTDLLVVAYKRIDQDTDKGTKTNIIVAAFTTCQARLKLYESLETKGTASCTTTWIPSCILGNLGNLKSLWVIIWGI